MSPPGRRVPTQARPPNLSCRVLNLVYGGFWSGSGRRSWSGRRGGSVVPAVDEALDRVDHVFDRGEAAAADGLTGDDAEKISTMFSHEPEVGVKCMRIRPRRAWQHRTCVRYAERCPQLTKPSRLRSPERRCASPSPPSCHNGRLVVRLTRQPRHDGATNSSRPGCSWSAGFTRGDQFKQAVLGDCERRIGTVRPAR